MKKIGRKFTPKEKLSAVLEWRDLGGGTRHAHAVARRHYCSAQSVYLWAARYDGTLESLENGDPTPHYFWNKYTERELAAVKSMLDSRPYIGRLELYGHLRAECAFQKSIRTLYRMIKKLNVAPAPEVIKYIPEPYETPRMVGVKWQIDVKYVPVSCFMGEVLKNRNLSIDGTAKSGIRFFQYTCIDEASRKRFIYTYGGIGVMETIDFIKRCIIYFGYKPLIIQTDNGSEFGVVNWGNTKINRVTDFLKTLGIEHKFIRPATPRHNGKVERSHRTDNQEFYAYAKFNSLEHCRALMKEWLHRYNYVRPMSVLGYKTPAETEAECLKKLYADRGQVTFKDIEHRQTGSTVIERHGVIRFVRQNLDLAFAPPA